MPQITYRSDVRITADSFIDLLQRSTLAERRPVDDPARIEKMLENADVIITAWDDQNLIGISRAITDFAYCCYLSDLAVDEKFQHRGIGKELVKRTHEASGPQTQLILLAAPKAIHYYPKIGMKQFFHCFVFDRKQ